jgi:hypothetical protein
MSQPYYLGVLIRPELMEALEQLYPARPPNPQDSEREIWMKAGERRLVEVLKAKYQEATDELVGVSLLG